MSYREKYFIFRNLFDMYLKSVMITIAVLSPCRFPSNQLPKYVSKEACIFQIFLNMFGMLLKWRPYFSSPFHLHFTPLPPCSRTNKASDSNWNLLSGLTPDEANIFRPSPPSVTHICRRSERELSYQPSQQ
jgi:hypothetical protein